eukprot:1270106-Amphidinium_carterae.3
MHVGSAEATSVPRSWSGKPSSWTVSGEVFQSPPIKKGRGWLSTFSATTANSSHSWARLWPTVRYMLTSKMPPRATPHITELMSLPGRVGD